MSRNSHLTDAIIGSLMSLAILGPWLYFTADFSTKPYADVVQSEPRYTSAGVVLEVQFTKVDGCEFKSLNAFQYSLGVWSFISWLDVDGNKGDRPPGEHTVRLMVSPDPYAEIVQMRTRHACGKEIVEGILATFHLND